METSTSTTNIMSQHQQSSLDVTPGTESSSSAIAATPMTMAATTTVAEGMVDDVDEQNPQQIVEGASAASGNIYMPQGLAMALSEHEQQQRLLMQQQQERQRQNMKQQLEFFHVMRQQQQQLQSQRETQMMATSQAIQHLLEENNALISSFYEQIRKTRPLAQTSNWGLVLDQIGQNLKTLTQLMTSSSGSAKTQSSPSQQPQFSSPMATTTIGSQTPQQFHAPAAYSNLGPHLKTNPHSTAAVLAAAAALAYSRYNSAVGSLNSSAHASPSSSPSWTLFSSGRGDVTPPYATQGYNAIPVIGSNSNSNSGFDAQFGSNSKHRKKLPRPMAKSAASGMPLLTHVQFPSLTNATTSPETSSPVELAENGEKKRPRHADAGGILERVESDEESYNTDDEMDLEEAYIARKKSKKRLPPKEFVSLPNYPNGSDVKKVRKPVSSSFKDEQVPAIEVLSEMEGLPKDFIESTKQFTKSEARHWQSIKPHVARAGKMSDALPDPDKWRAWVEITADLPLNNGGPIRRVLEVAVWCAERSCSDPNVLRVLNKALGPSVYKANAAGGCRRMALDMLQTFPESTAPPQSKEPKKAKSQSPPKSVDTVSSAVSSVPLVSANVDNSQVDASSGRA